MQSIFQQFATKVTTLVDPQEVTPSKSYAAWRRGDQPMPMAAQPAPITTSSQIVIPTIAWDWPVATSGSIAVEQFQFADFIPQSTSEATEYAASSDSFSSNYRSFLEFIDTGKFPSQQMLADAKEKIRIPQGDPSTSSSVPPGWTKITRAGIQRWAPIWGLSRSAQDWTSGVHSGAISNPGSVVVELENARNGNEVLKHKVAGTAAFQSLPGAQAAFQRVTISAKAWGQIAISPGTWFNSGLLRLGEKYVDDPEVFFGPTGLLRGRVSAFIVAYKAEFDFSSTTAVDTQLAGALSDGEDLQAFGIPVEATGPISAEQQTSIRLKSTDPAPSIVLAVLERFD